MNTSSAAAFNDRFASRLQTLTPTLRKIARTTVGTLSEYDQDDLIQAMNEGLVKQAKRNPSFLDQEDGFWLKKARWVAQSLAGSGRAYTRRVDAEIITHGDDGDELSNFDFMSSDSGDMEERIGQIDALERIAALLTPDELILVKMLYQGYSQDEIAARIGVVKTTITMRKQRIAEKLAEMMGVSYPRPAARKAAPAAAPAPTPTPAPAPLPTNPRCKLSAEQALAIRAEYQPRKVTQAALAAKYGVSRSTIGRITRRETWKNI